MIDMIYYYKAAIYRGPTYGNRLYGIFYGFSKHFTIILPYGSTE